MNIRHVLAKMPTWFLRYLVWRDKRLGMAGHFQHNICWAGHELSERINPTILGPKNPVGVPEWLLTNPKSYGYDDEPEISNPKRVMGVVKYNGVPFYYLPCFCDHTVGENCEACGYGDEPDGLEKAINLIDRLVKVNNSDVYWELLQEIIATPADTMLKAMIEWEKRNKDD